MTLREMAEKEARDCLVRNNIVDAAVPGDTDPDDPNFVLRLRSDAIADAIERIAKAFAERALRANIKRVYEVESNDTQPNEPGRKFLVDLAIAAAERGDE